MIITDRERKILNHVHLKANVSTTVIAKEVKIQDHSLRYSLANLKQQGLIHKRSMVDVHILGLTQFSVFFSAVHRDRKSQERLQKLILESPKTSDVFGLGGDYQYGVVLTVMDVQEVYEFLDQLSKLPGISIVEKSIGIRTSTTLYQRSYLINSVEKRSYITYRRSNERVAIDELDKTILSALNGVQHNSIRDLALKLQIPHATLTQRIRALEDKKVIIGQVYGMSCQKLGMQTYRLLVYTKGFRYDTLQDLHRFSLEHANIICLFQIIGSWDFEFEIEVETPQKAVELAQEVYEFLMDGIITVKILPLFSFPKSSGYPFPMKFDNQFDTTYTQ